MYEIEISNCQQWLDVDEAFLREVARRTLSEEQVAEARVGLALVDNAAIRVLNREYLDHDDDTDVLSFLLEGDQTIPPQGTCVAGAESSKPQMGVPQPRPPCGTEGAMPQPRRPPRGAGKRLEGEVIVSTEMALRSAAEFHWTPHEELVLYVVHGLLHLLGYDDRSETETRLMRSRERTILKHWKLTPRYARADGSAAGRSLPVDGASGVDS